MADDMPQQPNNLLHGVTLEMMLEQLVESHGWPKLGALVRIKCFNSNPSIKSSLTFLRKTPWARAKVEDLYVSHLRRAARRENRKIAKALK